MTFTWPSSDAIATFSAMCAVLALYISWRTANKQAKMDLLNLQKIITDRLYELDRLALEHPELELALTKQANRDSEEYFFSDAKILDKDSIKLKLYIHYHINVIDELVNVFCSDKAINESLESESWELYILLTMKHPLFQEVYTSCQEIWGTRLKEFIENRDTAAKYREKLNALYNNARNV